MLPFLLSNCNYYARFSFFSSFCNFLLCYLLYTSRRVFMPKKEPGSWCGFGLFGEICSGGLIATAENSEQIEE